MDGLILSRFFHSTSSTFRQRGIALKRLLRKKQAPFHKVLYIDHERDERKDESSNYPNEIPKYPPGKWGSTNEKLAWKWHEMSEYLRKYSTSFQRNAEIYLYEKNMWYHTIDSPMNFPETLNFYQYISRTTVSNEEPILVTGDELHSNELSELSEQLKTLLLAGHSCKKSKSSLISDMMDCIYNQLLPHFDHLKDAHIDEGGDLEAFFKRSGYDELKDSRRDFTVLDEEDLVKYQIRSKTVWQMRQRNPIGPAFSPTSIPTTEDGLPQYNYDPAMFDLKTDDFYGISVIPLHKTWHSDQFLTVKAGYWADTPFWQGDPHEFGTLGVVEMSSPEFMKDLKDCDKEISRKVLDSYFVGEGLITGFTWTTAQAWNQGFNFYDDITYPFSSQIILTDGRNFRFLVYQLNSITATAKASDSDVPLNVVWASEPMSLYDSVSENGDVVGWNAETLKRIVHCLNVKTMEIKDRTELRPCIQSRRSDEMYMNIIGEKDWERPPAERIFTLKRPHPNESYFQKMVNRSELLDDIRKTFPGIDKLPNEWQERSDAHKRERHRQKGRMKSEPGPAKWR